jgi:hypothetical protein
MASFTCLDFAKEIHLLSNQKVFARGPGKDSSFGKESAFITPVSTWAGD